MSHTRRTFSWTGRCHLCGEQRYITWQQRGKLHIEWIATCLKCLDNIKSHRGRKARHTAQLNLFAEEPKR